MMQATSASSKGSRPAEGPPVFGIGWPRTGTTSLRHALERLGFGPCGRGGRPHDVDACVAHYQAHVDAVCSTLGSRVLVFRAEEGWAPLAAFLGVEVPAEPFPRRNTREAIRRLGRHET